MFRLVSPAPLPMKLPAKLLAALFKVNALEYVPARRAAGRMPLARFVAFRLVTPAPLPVNPPRNELAGLENVLTPANVWFEFSTATLVGTPVTIRLVSPAPLPVNFPTKLLAALL